MIADHIKNGDQYTALSKRIKEGINYLLENDLSALKPGRYEIDGDNLFYMILDYNPKAIEDGKCEVHKKYIDIQYIIKGSELMGYGRAEAMATTIPYDVERDCCYVDFTGDFVRYTEGMFAIFFPQDAHMPGISDGDCTHVRKVAMKIRI